MATNHCHRQLLKLLSRQSNQLDRLYAKKSREIATALSGYKQKSKTNVWLGNKRIESKLDKVLEGLDIELKAYIKDNVTTAANMSNDCIDAMIASYTKGIDIDDELKKLYLARNAEAVVAYSQARVNGVDASKRVWKPGKQTKEQLEYFMKSGLADGRSAKSLATDIKKYLKEPDKRFRRVRDENGKLQLSNPAKNYNPGVGVYRSSYKNALRFTRNEINIAYRQADYMRIQELDFVVGVRVNLSSAHPKPDICDAMAGVYPKGFRFVGWHVMCLCFTTSVLLPQEEFIKGVNSGKFDRRKFVRSIPKAAKNYLNDNADKIKGWSNDPYFISDNFKKTKDGFELKKSVTKNG